MIQWTRSPSDSTPTTLPPSTTGRWRQRLSVMRCMHSSTVLLGFTVTAGLDLISRTLLTATFYYMAVASVASALLAVNGLPHTNV